MKKRRIKAAYRFATFLLAILFVILAFPVAASAENENPLLADTELDQPFSPLEEGDLSYAQLQALKVEDVVLPEAITFAEAREKEHVNRLYAQENNLNTAVFQNRSGTKTAYVFDKPIKYVTSTGEIKDKSTRITATKLSGYAYAMADNSFQVYFGPTTAKGVRLDYGAYSLSMLPEPSALVSAVALGEDARSVIYNGAFGANTALRYTTELSGIKEDVILLSNVGKYSFRFLLTASGLTPVQLDSGAWVLVNADNEAVVNFGSILINDSAGHLAMGTMTVTPRPSGGYVMTVNVPAEFLQADTTVYPVYIDPSVNVSEGTATNPLIEDYGIYNNSATAATAASNTNQHIFNKNTGAVVYKFYDFMDSSGAYFNYDEYKIGKVTLRVTSYSNFSATVTARPMAVDCGTDATQYSTTLFTSSVSNNSSSASISVTNRSKFQIDITEIVRGWARYNKGLSNNAYENPKNGFMLTQSNTTNAYLAAVEATGTTNVRYTIDYSLYSGAYMFKNKNTAAFLNVTYPASGTPSALSASQSSARNYLGSFVVKYVQDGKHLIMPMYNLSYALYCSDVSNSTVSFLSIPNTVTNHFYWTIESSSTGDSVIFKNSYTGTVLYSTSAGVSAVRPSDAAVSDAKNWYTVRSYGSKQFRRVTNTMVNCEGYAMFIDAWPSELFAAEFLNYELGIENSINAQNFEQKRTEYDALIKSTFENSFTRGRYREVYTATYQEDFDPSYNGEYKALASNQYRVLLRTGIKLVGNNYEADYHFWYQTLDGRWAHKSGEKPPCLFPWGVTPKTQSSGGWSLDFIVRDGDGNLNNLYFGEFYDNPTIHCYVITVS